MNYRLSRCILPVVFLVASILSGCSDDLISPEDQPDAVRPKKDDTDAELAELTQLQRVQTARELALADRLAPIAIDEVPRGVTPFLPDDDVHLTLADGYTHREPDPFEVDAGLSTVGVITELDLIELSPTVGQMRATTQVLPMEMMRGSLDFSWWWNFLMADSDGDCNVNIVEMSEGTDWFNPDTDNDGWYDGACNQRYRLRLLTVKAHDEQEDSGDDETYIIIDDVRHPNSARDLDDYWDLDDGDSVSPNHVVAERIRGTNNAAPLSYARVEVWEDDVEVWDTWTVDDLLLYFDIDIAAHLNGQQFSHRDGADGWWDNWDYELTFRVETEYFADPNPLSAQADTDGDGISERAEANVAADFGGITDPYRKDVLVEVDWMSGHYLTTQSKRMVTTQMYRYGIDLFVLRHSSLSVDDDLTRTEAEDLYDTEFTYAAYDAFRYAVMTEEIWNDASGVAVGDVFLIDDSTWWINGGVLAQAGTFIHELGHTFGLNTTTFEQIDTIGSVNYDSSMNYLFQATMVDYSYDDAGNWLGDDHDDWVDVDVSIGLKFSFGAWK